MSVSPPEPGDLVFVDTIPPRTKSFGDSRWLPIIEALKARKLAGEQAITCLGPFSDKKQAAQVASILRAVTRRKGTFEIAMRGESVYMSCLDVR